MNRWCRTRLFVLAGASCLLGAPVVLSSQASRDASATVLTIKRLWIEPRDRVNLETHIRARRAAAKLHSSSAAAWIALGRTVDSLYRLSPESRRAFARALALDPTSLPALLGMGQSLDRGSEPVEAMAIFTRALAIDSVNPEALYGSASAHVDLEQWTEATSALNSLLDVHVQDSRIYPLLTKCSAHVPGISSSINFAVSRLLTIGGFTRYLEGYNTPDMGLILG